MGIPISVASQNLKVEHSLEAGFRFMAAYGDKENTMNFNYRKAQIKRGKKWFIAYSYRNPDTGKFQRFKVYEDINRYKGKEQEDYAELLMKAINYGLKTGWNPFKKPEIKVAFKSWTLIQGFNFFKQGLEKRGLKKRTVQTYESVLRMFSDEFRPINNDNIREISKSQIKQVLLNAKQKHKWNNTTFNKYLIFLRAIFNYLIDEESGILEANPANRIKPLPETIVGNKAWTDEEFKLILEKSDPELKRFIMFIYNTGARPSSVAKVHSDDILADRKLLWIPGTQIKDKEGLYIPVSDEFIKEYKKNGKVFEYEAGYYSEKFLLLRRKLELPESLKLYSVKHTRCCHLAEAGASPYTIMQLFGHSSLEVTMSYMRGLGVNINREAVEKGIRF